MEEQSLYLTPFQRKLLHKSLQNGLRPEYHRRIEIMLLADTGHSQAQICKTLGCSQEMARYWITQAQAGLAHHFGARPMGRPKAVSEQYLTRLKELASHSPREHGYPFERWTAQWLGKHLEKELGIKISNCHVNRLLKEMGLSTRNRNNTTEKVTDSSINISDLQSNSQPDLLWSLNLIKINN